MGKHHSHPGIINRLKRAKGHLEKVISMIESEEACLLVAQQMHAVSKAVFNAKQTYIKDHIDHCLDRHAVSDPEKLEASILEFKEITKYLN